MTASRPPARAALIGPGAPFELVDADVLGATMPSFVRRAGNLRELLVSAAERFGDQPYLEFPERRFPFRGTCGSRGRGGRRPAAQVRGGKG